MSLLGWFTLSEPASVATWLGLVVSAVGLTATYFQALAARRASANAATAAVAADTAVRRLRRQIDLTAIGYANGQLDAFALAARTGQFLVAQALFGPLRRAVRQVHASKESPDSSLHVAIRTIEVQLERGRSGHSKFNPHVLSEAIDGMVERVTAWESALAHETGA
jgi:hypothetical protein